MNISDLFTNGKIGTAYSSSVKVTGGTGSYTWHDIKGELPAGLEISYDSDTAAITGTPTESGDFTGTLVVSVTQPYYADSYNSITSTLYKTFVIKIVSEDAEIPDTLIEGENIIVNVKAVSADLSKDSSDEDEKERLYYSAEGANIDIVEDLHPTFPFWETGSGCNSLLSLSSMLGLLIIFLYSR